MCGDVDADEIEIFGGPTILDRRQNPEVERESESVEEHNDQETCKGNDSANSFFMLLVVLDRPTNQAALVFYRFHLGVDWEFS